MFAEQRQSKIMQLLHDYEKVDVNSLTKILSVSEATVRRDLEKLEEKNLLTRTHGGAIVNIYDSSPSFTENQFMFSEEDNQIGKACAGYIQKGDVVAILSNDIGVAIINSLPSDLQCVVVTNFVDVMKSALVKPLINLIFLGGTARSQDGKKILVSGEITCRTFDCFHIHKAFVEPEAIDIEAGVTLSNYEDFHLMNAANKNADETIIVAPATSFDEKRFIKLWSIKYISRIFTSKNLSSKYKEFFYNNGISLHLDYDL